MTDHDDFRDPFLSDMLNAASGAHPDTTAAYGIVTGRVRAVRRRRMAMVSGAAAALLIATGVLAAVATRTSRPIDPASTGPDGRPVATVTTTSTTIASTTTTTEGSTTTAATTTAATTTVAATTITSVPTGEPGNGSTVVTTPTTVGSGGTPDTPGTTRPPTTPPPTTRPPTTAPPTTRPPTTTSPTTRPPTTTSAPTTTTSPPTTTTKKFICAGGSATVSLTGDVLGLVSSSTSPGYALVESQVQSRRVRLRWEGAEGRSRLEVGAIRGRIIGACLDRPTDDGDDESDDEPADHTSTETTDGSAPAA